MYMQIQGAAVTIADCPQFEVVIFCQFPKKIKVWIQQLISNDNHHGWINSGYVGFEFF